MRTLKKVLALSLALAMIFSLTAVAAYKDADKINADLTSDIDLLNALGVMQGDNNGNFNPKATITRAEAAKMMYVLKTNNTEAPTSFIGGAEAKKLNDIKGHWGESYISYCAEMGIVVGQGAGKFNPQGKVTGQELAKMLLLTVGYKAEASGFFGAAWGTNVTKVASDSGLFTGYELAYSAPATREYAAKLFATAITDVAMVKYSQADKEYTEQYVGKTDTIQTLGNKVFSMDYVTGLAVENNNLKVGSVKAKADKNSVIVVAGTDGKYGTQDDVNTTVKSMNIPDDMLGQVVKVYVNTKTNNGYGASDAGVSKVYNVTKADVDLTNSSKTIAFDGFAKMDHSDKTINAYYYGHAVKSVKTVNNADLDDVFNNSTDKVRLVDVTGDGYIDSVFVQEAGYARVKAVDTAKGQFTLQDAADKAIVLLDETGAKMNFGNTEDGKKQLTDHVVFAETVAKDDVVKLTGTVVNGKTVYTVSKLVATEGKFTALNSTGSKATIGDKTYRMSAMAVTGSVLPTVAELGKTFTFYTDGTYIVFAEGAGTTVTQMPKNLAYVIAAKHDATLGSDAMGVAKVGPKVEVLKADGTRVAYEYNVPTGAVGMPLAKTDDAKAMVDTVVEYVMNGEKVYFKTAISKPTNVTAGATSAATALVKDKKTFGGNLVNDDSYFFVKSGADASDKKYAVMKMSEFKADVAAGNVADDKQLYTMPVNGLPTVVFAVVNLDIAVPSDVTTDYAFVTGGKYATLNDKNETIYKVPAVNSKGEKVELVLADQAQVMTTEKVYSITTTDGKTTFAALAVDASNWILDGVQGYSADSKLIKFEDKADYFKITADTKIHYVADDGGDVVIVADGTVAIAQFATGTSGTLANNAMYRLNAAGDTVTDLFVQVDGAAVVLNGVSLS